MEIIVERKETWRGRGSRWKKGKKEGWKGGRDKRKGKKEERKERREVGKKQGRRKARKQGRMDFPLMPSDCSPRRNTGSSPSLGE